MCTGSLATSGWPSTYGCGWRLRVASMLHIQIALSVCPSVSFSLSLFLSLSLCLSVSLDGPDEYRLLGLRAAACATGTGPDPAKERLYPRSGPHANMLWPARGGHASDPRRTRVLLVCGDREWGPLVAVDPQFWGPSPLLDLAEKTNLAAMCSYQSTDQPTFSLRTLPPEAASPSCRHFCTPSQEEKRARLASDANARQRQRRTLLSCIKQTAKHIA